MYLKQVVDGHCDTLTALTAQKRSLGERSDRGQLDLPRMFSGGLNVQFFAAFISPRYKDMALKKCLQLIDQFYAELNANKEVIELALHAGDIRRITGSGKIAALLSIEGGESLTGDISILRILYRLGVRSLTLTWNGRNELGDGVGEGETGGGLSLFGRLVVREMNSLGMLIDISHLNEKGFWDVAEISNQPFAATHANCRAICNHPRNLSDGQLEYLAKTGGIVGLTFVPDFIAEHNPDLEKLIRHIDYIASRFGTGCIGLGSDFDGMEGHALGLEDVTCLPRLVDALIKRGYGDDDVTGIMGANWMRLLDRVLK
ncbi:dipeptidase [Desulfallas sp. Bu1-1]|jgi:membrane dipeptidase|uniref:dipeptidase n=1 Tax=Desulfallas sp. Bu1-1 TaxID=2787620 RepID=UPI0018A0849A|nr:dipeptidase [Desulfallas sp. Bu1-1]MBF7083052.1 dipeptidase [Desulfallas sp. Bu1-1]